MDRSRIASAVAGNLFATEAGVEEAIARTTLLMQTMTDAQRGLDLPTTAGDAALRRVSAALDALEQAQSEILRAHDALEALRRRAGLRLVGFGPLLKPTTGAAEKQPAD